MGDGAGTLATLTRRFSHDGAVKWMGVRPERRAPVIPVETVRITPTGLDGDRRASGGKRTVTLLQWEHLEVIAALSTHPCVDPAVLRRNIAVSGINLLGLRAARFRIGTAELQGTGLCAPCARMEDALGPGGFTAVRGHGGITADVLVPGDVSLGDSVIPL